MSGCTATVVPIFNARFSLSYPGFCYLECGEATVVWMEEGVCQTRWWWNPLYSVVVWIHIETDEDGLGRLKSIAPDCWCKRVFEDQGLEEVYDPRVQAINRREREQPEQPFVRSCAVWDTAVFIIDPLAGL